MTMDIATLGLRVDTRDLKNGTQDVERFTKSTRAADKDVKRATDNIRRAFASASAGIVTASRNAREAIDRIATSAENVGRSMRNIGAGMSVAITAPIVLAGKNALAAASDLQESQAMFDEVFKGSATATRAWADDLARRIGRSTNDLQAQAAQFQQVLTAFYPDRAQAAEMSRTMASLAQDVASFYNLTEEDAVSKLRAGLTGEMESLKALGVVISADAIAAEGLAMGLAKTKDALTEQDKAAARAQLIIKGLSDATGDAERTSGSYANQQRALAAAVGDLSAQLGAILLPAMTAITAKLTEWTRAFSTLSPETQKWIVGIAAAAAALGPLVSGIGLFIMTIKPLVGIVAALATPFGAAAAAVAALGGAAIYAYTHWDQLRAQFPAAVGAVEAGAAQMSVSLGRIGSAIASAFGGDHSAAAEQLTAFVQDAIDGIDRLIDGAFGAGSADAARAWVQSVVDAVASLDAELHRLAQAGTDATAAFLASLDAGMASLAQSAVQWGADVVSGLAEGLADIVAAAADAIRSFGAALSAGMKSLAASAAQWGRDIVQGIINGVKQKAVDLKNAVSGLAQGVKEWFTGPVEIKSPSRVFMEYGGYITDGLAIGIEDGAARPLATISDLAQQLVQSTERLAGDIANAFGDWLTGGIESFKDFAKTITSSFKNMIADMIATAVRNPIRLAITGAMGGMPGGAAAGVPGGGMPGVPGGGMLSGILGSWKGGTGLLGGFGSVVSGLFSGGLGGAAGALTTALGGATSGLAGLATAAGAIAAPLAAVAAVFSFFKSKTKELDRGLRVTVSGMDAVIEQYRRTEKSRFLGLSKKRRTRYEDADAEIADPIDKAIDGIQQSVLDAAKALNIGATAFDAFAYQFKLSTKGMTDEQALAAIQAEIAKFGDAYAAMIPGLKQYQVEGEGALATLDRLTNTIGVVNGALGGLGLTLYDMSVKGAGAAAAFADLFGGLDQFAQASSAYYEAFYSDAERFARLQEVSNKAIRDAGLAVPATREAYRRLVEAQNLSTEAGRKAAAVLLQLAPAFDQIYDAAEAATIQIYDAADAATIAARQAIAEANASRANLLDSLLTDQQRAAQAQAEIAATFAALNLQVPTTLDGLRAIIAGLDLTGEAGRKALAQIAGIADALKEKLTPVTQAAERATSGGSSGRATSGGSSGRDNAASEREQLERQLLQLQGNVTALRRRELAALDPANRALQKMVWRLEDARAAMDNLTTDGFTTLVDYELARAKAANVNTAPAAEDRKAQESRQARDSAVLAEMRDYMMAVVNNTHRAARETRDLRMIQEGGVA